MSLYNTIHFDDTIETEEAVIDEEEILHTSNVMKAVTLKKKNFLILRHWNNANYFCSM